MEEAGSASLVSKTKDQEAEGSEEEVWDDSDEEEDEEEEDDDDTIARIRRAHFAQAAAMNARKRAAPRARPMSQKRKMEAVKNFHDFTKKLKKDTGISIRSLVGNNILDLSDYSSEDSKSDSDGLSDEEFVVNPSAVQELNEENESYIDPETGDFVEAKKRDVTKPESPAKVETEKAEVPKTLSISDIINEGDLDLSKNVEISEVEGSELCQEKTAEELLDLKQEETSQDFDLSEKLKEMGEPIDKTEDGVVNPPKEGDETKPETEEEKKLNSNTLNVRRNIREVMDEKNLDASTLTAQRQESERLARVQEQQKIIREVQRQIALNRQNKIHQKTLSLLQGGSSILKKSAPGQKVNLSHTVTMKMPSGEIKRTIIKPGGGVDVMKLPKPTTSAAGQKPGKSEQKKEVVEIVDSSSGEESSSSSSDSDDCIMLSDSELPPSPEAEEDPHNSGLHVNDAYNIPDEQGRVQINIGHPENEEDIFLAPQIARIIKPHQIGGVRFLFDNIIESTDRFSTSTGFGCILAHSMGLGKTLQIVCFTDIFLRHTSSKTVLCIMPINTLQNWVAEFNMWLPLDATNSPLAAHGDVRTRNFPIYVLNDSHKTLQMRAKVVKDWTTSGGVLMIGYELYRLLSMKKDKKPRKKKKAELKLEEKEREEREKKKEDGMNDDTQGSDAKGLEDKTGEDDPNKMEDGKDKEDCPVDGDKKLLDEMYEALVKPGPDLVICDEGHRIKNSHSNISYALKQMRTKRRVVLTGYPLQNNLLEYWCMVDFVRPNYLGSKTEFCNMFERPIQNGQCIDSTPQDIRLMRYRAHVLHSLLVGFVQRRSHAVLQSTLPQKEEYVLLVRMTPLQRKLYDRFMNEVVRSTSVPNPLKAFAICCKIWNHPDVLYNFLKKRNEVNIAIEEDLDLEEIGGVTKAGRNKNGKVPAKRGPKPRGAAKKPAATIPPNTSGPPRPDAFNNQQYPPSGPYPPNYRPDQQGSYPPYPNYQNPGQYYPPNQPYNQNYDSNYYQQQPPYGNNFPNQQPPTPYPQNNPEGQGYNQNYWNNGGQYYDNSGYYNNQQQYPNQPGPNYNNPAAPNYQENSAPPNYPANQPGNFQAPPSASNFPNAPAPGFQGAPSTAPNYSNPPSNYPENSSAPNYQAATPAAGEYPQQYPPNYTAPTDPTYSGNAVQPYVNNQNVPNQQRPFERYNNPQNYPEYNSNAPAPYPNNQSQYPNQNYPQGYPTNAPYDANAPAPFNQYNQPPNYPGYGNMPAASANQQEIKHEPNTNYPNSEVKTDPETQNAAYNVPYNYNHPNTSTYPDRPENSNGNYNQYPQYPSPLETKPPLNSGSSGSPITSWPITELKTEVDRFKAEEKLENKSESDGEVKIEDLDTKTIVKDEKTPKKEMIVPKQSEPEVKGKKKDKDMKSDESDNEKEVKKGKQKGRGKDSKKSEKPKPRGRPKAKGRKDRKASKEKNDSESEESEKEEKLSREEELALVKKAEDMTYDWACELLKDYIPGIIENSAKMELFFYLLTESIKMGDRILLFSQSLFTLNLIEDFLERNYIPGTSCLWQRNTSYFRLDGSTHALEREKLINEFNANPNVYLFLVSTRAGSLGINLVGANRVIVFDASWNPCHDTQAVCRVYRYGQKKPCFVYRFVMDWCLEKKIYDRQINKQGMADRVVDECNPDAVLSMKEITNLCFDNDEKESAPKDLTEYKDKYIDVLMQGIITKLSTRLSKEPFQHESLLVDRKEKKLSSAEKRLAQRGYELEKKAALAPKPTSAYRTVRGADGSLVQRPVGTVRPMQHGARWIPADVWRRQGMTAQEMTLPLDVVIPTNSSEKTNIVLKAGQRVMVLKSPKGIYMQLESGKIIAIKTSFKGLAQKGADNKDTPVGKKVLANRPNIPGSLKNNSAITISTSKAGPRYQRIIRPNLTQKISRPMLPGQKMSDIRNRISEMRSYTALRKGPLGPGRLRPALPGSVSITKIPRDVKKSDNDSDSNTKSKNDDSDDDTQVLDSDDEATDTDARVKVQKNDTKHKPDNNDESNSLGSGSTPKTDEKPQNDSESSKQESPEPIVLTTDEKLPSEEALEKSTENDELRNFSREKIESASMSPGERVERKINLLKNYRHQRPTGARAPNESSLSQLEKTASVLNKESMPDFRRNLDDITQSYSPTGEEKPATKSRKKKTPTKVDVESQERQSSMSHSVSSLLGQGSKPHRSEIVPNVPVAPVGSQPRVPSQDPPLNAMHSHGHMSKAMPPISGVVPAEMTKAPMPHPGLPPPGQGYPANAPPDGYPQYAGYGMGYGAYPPAPYYPGYAPGYYPPPYAAAPPAAAPPPEGYLPPNPQW